MSFLNSPYSHSSWFLLWPLTILSLFRLGLLRRPRIKKVFIGMNRLRQQNQQVPWSIRLSARKAIGNEVPRRVRWQWWKQAHPLLFRYGFSLVLSSLFLSLGLPVLVGYTDIISIDSDSNFAGDADYDPQIYVNSKGEILAVYTGNENVSLDNRTSCKYSQDDGATWSDRYVLFDLHNVGLALIDDDLNSGMQISGQLFHDVLYLSLTLRTGAEARVGFTKCNISDVTNVANYQSWLSADGTPSPSQGNGSDGQGYDLVSSNNCNDPSINVQGSSDIFINFTLGYNIHANMFDGNSWNTSGQSIPAKIIDLSDPIENANMVRSMKDGDRVIDLTVRPADLKNYIGVCRCLPTDDPLSAGSWKSMDGLSSHDIVIDTGLGAMGHPELTVDANNNVHVATYSTYNEPDGYRRAFHNWWKPSAGAWQEGSLENNAGAMIVAPEPYILNPWSGNVRVLGLTADAGGNVILLVSQGVYSGLWTILWKGDTESWDQSTYFQHTNVRYFVVPQYYIRNFQSSAYFFLSTVTIDEVLFIATPGIESGSPWWDPVGGMRIGGPLGLMSPEEIDIHSIGTPLKIGK